MIDRTSEAFLAQQRFLQSQADMFRNHSEERKTINYLGIGCSSVNKDDTPSRIPNSTKILEKVLQTAKSNPFGAKVETKIHLLDNIDFQHCEANYSIQGHYCTRPCWISQRMSQLGKIDPLTELYNDLIDRADVVIIATPIRRGAASSLYYKLVERLNCIENQKEVYDVDLVHHKLMGMVILGAQDGAQQVMGQMMSVRAELGFAFAKSPYVAYTAGGLLNDRIDLISEQIQRDTGLIDGMIEEMVHNQLLSITQRRKK